MVRAVQRALAILRAFEGQGAMSLAEVTQATGLDKGTTRRLLLTLHGDGFVAFDPTAQRYTLGAALRRLAASAAPSVDLRAAAAPILTALAAELHVTVFLSVFQDGRAVCLERFHDMKGMEVRWWAVGGILPLNCGGAPKLLLAHRPEDDIERALAGELVGLTPRSETDPGRLRARLVEIRRRGWELAVDDVVVGLTALACPVRDADGGVRCAVSIAGLTPQLCHGDPPEHLARVMRAADEIARLVADS